MPNRSSACDPSSPDRARIASDLYLRGGARDASNRCDINARLETRSLFEELANALRIEPHHTVVDVCAGTGQHVQQYAPRVARAVGFDFSEAAVADARRRGAEVHVADAASLPLPDASVDGLSCCFGVYYLQDLTAAIREWARVLRPGGRIVVCGPARGTNVELYEFHARATGEGPGDADTMAWGYIEEFVRPALVASGFSEVVVDTFVNPVAFPDPKAFLDYWRSTSLFLRSAGESAAANAETGARLLADHHGPLTVTKRVSVVSAARATQR